MSKGIFSMEAFADSTTSSSGSGKSGSNSRGRYTMQIRQTGNYPMSRSKGKRGSNNNPKPQGRDSQ